MPIKPIQYELLKKCLKMEDGYVLDFTDNTFKKFFDGYNINIYNEKYSEYGSSKGKRMRAFLELEGNITIIEVLTGLANIYVENENDRNKIFGIITQLSSGNTSDKLQKSFSQNNSMNSASISGNNNSITQTINNYFGIGTPEYKLFEKIDELAKSIDYNTEILKAISGMRETIKTSPFIEKYKFFMSVISSHVTVFTPILSELSQYL